MGCPASPGAGQGRRARWRDGFDDQTYKLEEADFRGARFATTRTISKGNNDLLSITRPDVIERSTPTTSPCRLDMVETNTFSSTSIAMADYKCGAARARINLRCRRLCAPPGGPQENCSARASSPAPSALLNRARSRCRPTSTGPTSAPSRQEQVVTAHRANRALLDGGVDALLVETIFDTLNCKAALFGIEQVFDRRGARRACP